MNADKFFMRFGDAEWHAQESLQSRVFRKFTLSIGDKRPLHSSISLRRPGRFVLTNALVLTDIPLVPQKWGFEQLSIRPPEALLASVPPNPNHEPI
jgi:hypothetical protein